MADRLAHRGPDDEGVWVDAHLGVALGHRRLSVLDLSAAGHQPMTLPTTGGQLAISYNGEIFNHTELRRELGGDGFVGSGDTESLLHSARAFGIEETIRRCRGMFALGLVDTSARTLTLLRDRLGEKPLYVATAGHWLAFASEVAAFAAVDGLLTGIEPTALAPYLATGSVPAPLSIHRGVRSLLPGEIITVQLGEGCVRLPEPGARTYWRASDHLRPHATGDVDETLRAIDEAIGEAVRLRLLSDVPLGAFLSGGIDSSLVVAHAVEATGSVRTFTISFPDAERDEAPLAATIARHLGTVHEEFAVTAADALAVVPLLPGIHSEPHADPSSVPTLLLSGRVRREVTVALSGDGGDELFAGYERQAEWGRWRPLSRGGPISAAASVALRPIASSVARRGGRLAARLDNLAMALSAESAADSYLVVGGRWKQPHRLLRDTAAAPILTSPLLDPLRLRGDIDSLSAASYIDLVTYLPDLVLVKADRCSMAHGLELRSPLLDHHVVELALGIGPDLKRCGGFGKWALRQLVARRLPKEVVDAPKSGFEPPIAGWLRGALRSWGEELLAQPAPVGGLLDLTPVRAAWRRHQAGEDASYRLWTVLSLLAWADHWRADA